MILQLIQTFHLITTMKTFMIIPIIQVLILLSEKMKATMQINFKKLEIKTKKLLGIGQLFCLHHIGLYTERCINMASHL